MSTYTVQSIIDRRDHQKNQRQYLIKWKGYPISESTWQPVKNLVYVKQMIMDFDEYYDCQNQEKQRQKNCQGNDNLRKQALKARMARRSNRGKATKVPIENADKQIKRQTKKQNTVRNMKNSLSVISAESQQQSIHSKYLATFQHQHQAHSLNMIKENLKFQENQDKTDKATDEGNTSKESKKQIPPIENLNREQLEILGMRKNQNGEYFFLVESSTGLTSYKNREYLLKNYPQSLILFYESKMIFVQDKNLH